jgi:hypothetical protein
MIVPGITEPACCALPLLPRAWPTAAHMTEIKQQGNCSRALHTQRRNGALSSSKNRSHSPSRPLASHLGSSPPMCVGTGNLVAKRNTSHEQRDLHFRAGGDTGGGVSGHR